MIGVVLLGPDDTLEHLARKRYPVTVDATMPLPYDKTLIVEPNTTIPWDLLPAAFHFLERWDAAVPLWRYGVKACDVGTPQERERTEAVVRDLRVLLHSVELLFVRDNEAGQALIAAYREELDGGGEKRLAFLRAFYRVKPRLCVLPRSWLAEVRERSAQDARSLRGPRGARKKSGPLVEVEIAPGRFVKCYKGDEDIVREKFARGRGNG